MVLPCSGSKILNMNLCMHVVEYLYRVLLSCLLSVTLCTGLYNIKSHNERIPNKVILIDA